MFKIQQYKKIAYILNIFLKKFGKAGFFPITPALPIFIK